jgi:hypothetical protein
MRKLTLLFLAISMAAFVSSCKKEESSTPANNNNTGGGSNLTKTEMLTAKKWKLVGLTVGGADFYSQFDDCDKDDTFEYKTDGTYIEDEGATKCDPSDPQVITTATWKFTDNETKLEADGVTATIKELTATKMVLEGDFLGSPAVSTFSNQ